MRKKVLVLLFAVCVIITPSLYAALAAYDGFAYPENNSIDGQSGGTGWNGAWNLIAHEAYMRSPGLEYVVGSNLFKSSGNLANFSARTDAGEIRINVERNLSSSIGGSDGSVAWCSFLVNFNTIATVDFFITIGGAEIGKSWGSTLGIINNGGVAAQNDTTYLVVTKLEYKAGNDDIYVWVNPDLTTEPSTASASAHQSKALSAVSKVQILPQGYPGNFPNVDFDEIRLGDTYADVVQLFNTPPSAPAEVMASDGQYNSRVLITWAAEDYATKYAVYRNTTDNSGTATELAADISQWSYGDASAVTGQTYYYWVKAGNPHGYSAFSASDSGFRGSGNGIDISGYINDPNATYGSGVDYNIFDDTTFGPGAGTVSGDIYLGVYALTLEGSASTPTHLSGALSGMGGIVLDSGGTSVVSYLDGTTASSMTGQSTVYGGMLALEKTAGVDAVTGEIELKGETKIPALELKNSNQIGDSTPVGFSGTIGGVFYTGGKSEALGVLNVQSHALIDLANGTGTINFAQSSGETWDGMKDVVIWRKGTSGKIYFGNTSSGLSGDQLNMTWFLDPAGMQAGFYEAAITADGEVVPGTYNPPAFDESPQAQTQRMSRYSVPGLDLMTGVTTPLSSGNVISCFGDSITWLDNANSYVNVMKNRLASGTGTSGLGITVYRNGINGGTAADIYNGKSGTQDSFVNLLVNQDPDIVTMFIGINDIWWAGTSAAAFQKTMADIVIAAQTNGITHFVMCTPWLRGEKPDGTNINDDKIVQFAGICSNAAVSAGYTFMDLHQLAMWYEQNNNNEKFVNFRPNYKTQNVLTYDTVHPNATGAELLANHISYGIMESMGVPEPAVLLPVGLGIIMLVHRLTVVGGK